MANQKFKFGNAILIYLITVFIFGDFAVAQDDWNQGDKLKDKNRRTRSENSDGSTLSSVRSDALPARAVQIKSGSSTKRFEAKQKGAMKKGAMKKGAKQTNLEIRTYGGDIQLRTFDFRGQNSPTQNRQVIVEMKKGTGSENERVIRGVIAEESWIDSTSGAIQFYNANELFESTAPNQFWIGVRCEEVPSESSLTGMKQTVLSVEDVVPDSAASEAGIEVKDVIRSWNNTTINSVPDLVEQIQLNQLKLATVSVVRGGKPLDVQLRPRARTSGFTKVRTIFAPSSELEVAEERIGQLKEMILANDLNKDQLFRFVVVGPGVNFGQSEIELQLKPDLQNRHAEITRMINRVAEKKFSVMFRDDNVRLLDSAELDLSIDIDELVPEQIWQSFEIGSNGRSLSFSMIAPQVLAPPANSIRVKMNKAKRIDSKSLSRDVMNGALNELSGGRFIFESPHREFNIEQIVGKEKQLQDLQTKLEKIQSENADLKAELKVIKNLLKSKN